MSNETPPEPDEGPRPLPDNKWVTMPKSGPASVSGYESWIVCECGSRMAEAPVEDESRVDCDCGRAYTVNFEPVSDATRGYPVCPMCHVGMTEGSGYWCPECDVALPATFIESYDDVLREYQLNDWITELRNECHADNSVDSLSTDDWHIHAPLVDVSDAEHDDVDVELHHCRRCCPECSCDCNNLDCDCTNDGTSLHDPNQPSSPLGHDSWYLISRTAVGEIGMFNCAIERIAQRRESSSSWPHNSF